MFTPFYRLSVTTLLGRRIYVAATISFFFPHIFAEDFSFFFFFAEKPLRRALASTFCQLKQILQLAATFLNISISAVQ